MTYNRRLDHRSSDRLTRKSLLFVSILSWLLFLFFKFCRPQCSQLQVYIQLFNLKRKKWQRMFHEFRECTNEQIIVIKSYVRVQEIGQDFLKLLTSIQLWSIQTIFEYTKFRIRCKCESNSINLTKNFFLYSNWWIREMHMAARKSVQIVFF